MTRWACGVSVRFLATKNAGETVRRARAVVADRSIRASKRAGTDALRAGGALVRAVSELVSKAVDQVVLGDERVASAAEAKHLLNRDEQAEALAGDVQRVVALAVPVALRLARVGRVMKVPWVFLASMTISIGATVRVGVKEIHALSSLIAYRLEQATGGPADPALVKKLAVDLYLHPRRAPNLTDDRLRMVRLTRRWLLRGAFGRKTQRRAFQALEAAERIDAVAVAGEWESRRKESGAPPSHQPADHRDDQQDDQ
jgi:hypothetical protein